MNPSSNASEFGFGAPPLHVDSFDYHVQHAFPARFHATSSRAPKKHDVKSTILVADADPIALAQTIRILAREDFNVFSAVCQASAVSAAMKLDLDVVVCDLSLWLGAPGQDLVAEIHTTPGREDVPIVFTSSGQGPNIIRRQHEFGGAYHIKKPFDPDVLMEFVERALWMPHLVKTHIQNPHFDTDKTGHPDSSGKKESVVINATEVNFGSAFGETASISRS